MKNLNYRHTIYASYFGYITQAIINNLLPLLFLVLQEIYRIPLQKITLLITFNFGIQLTVDLLSAKFVDVIGYRICIVAAHIFAAAGLLGLAFLPDLLPDPFVGLAACVVVYAIGGGLIEVLISPIVEACPTENKASAMSFLHSFYCWGVVGVIIVTTGFLFFFGKENWTSLAFIWAIIPAANAIAFCRVPLAKLTQSGDTLSFKELISMRLFWIFVLLMVASGASELAMSQWASAFAEQGLHIPKAMGDLAGPCVFSILMGLSRVFYAKCGEKIDLLNYIIFSAALCFCGYLTAALTPSPALSLIGCGLCGLSVGILWPGVFSIAASRCPRGGTPMFALLALAGDLGCSAGPTVVGMAAGGFSNSLRAGLLFAGIFPVILIFGSFACKRIQN